MEKAWVAELFERVRKRNPLVHNITNFVAMDISANLLLAAGASPAMVHAEEEAADFARISDALVINIGTLSPSWVAAMVAAATAARDAGKPWVLDPVGVGATAFRTATVHRLVALRPTIIRGNASEILSIAGAEGGGKGVDSRANSDSARAVAQRLAADLGTVIAVTGAVDYVTDGQRTFAIAGGHPLMTSVTAVGCAATALVGAFVAVESDAVRAAAAALGTLAVAGEIAAEGAAGPGSFRVRLLDTLATLDTATLTARLRLTV
ncbi:MAG: hydroxyethylthiazole kinase [Azospirillaceae bacterium]|nr:hydroxyethylthiazole kinase [Azospirillaceae bacterium]